MEQETIVNCVITAAKQVFEMMLGLEVSSYETKVEAGDTANGERVVALIGIGGTWIGTGMLSCSPEFACSIASGMLMAEYSAVNEDVLDAMAEMSNMIFGNTKTELEEQLGSLCLSIPTVIFGRNFSTRSVGQQEWNALTLHVGDHIMDLRICLKPNKEVHSRDRSQMRPYALHYGDS